MIRRPPRSTLDRSSAASDVYKRQFVSCVGLGVATDGSPAEESRLVRLVVHTAAHEGTRGVGAHRVTLLAERWCCEGEHQAERHGIRRFHGVAPTSITSSSPETRIA